MLAEDIVILVPTRNRPRAVPELLDAWDATGAKAKLVFCIDDDDPQLAQYLDYAGRAKIVVAPRMRLAGTLNYWVTNAAECAKAKAIGFFGDDHRPRTEGWDRRFAECLSGGAGVVYGNDLLMGSKMPTAVVMTADIPATLGYFCPPGFVHLCLDLVWKDWGEGMGRITYLDDVIIEHLHPANGKAKMDAGYEEVNSQDMVAADTKAYHWYKEMFLHYDLERLLQLP